MKPYEIYQAYIADCKRFGWEPSVRGLHAYAHQVKAGLREKWKRRAKG